MAKVTPVTDETFEDVVLKAERPVIVDFWATWCAPCKLVAPVIEHLAEKYDGAIDFVSLDVDANPGVSQALGIMTMPTIAFFRPGMPPMAQFGARPAEQFEAYFGLSQYATSKAT
ncbi:MAG TPA: thioredoxin [Candidatus Limnocylindrales bacterium]|jgi:thioredoxin 1